MTTNIKKKPLLFRLLISVCSFIFLVGFNYQNFNNEPPSKKPLLVSLKELINNNQLGEFDSKDNINIKTPKMLIIPNYIIYDILKEFNLDVEKEWQRIINSLPQNFFDHSSSLPESFLLQSEALSKNILKKFKEISSDNKYKHPPLEKFVRLIKENKTLLTISRFDSNEYFIEKEHDIINTSNTHPDYQDIMKDIGRFVSSCLTRIQLNTLTLNDKTDIINKPNFSLLVKETIKVNNKNIPTSCLVFSQDPDTRASITKLVCTYGYNIKTIKNLVANDIFFVDKYSEIISIISPKNTRWFLDKNDISSRYKIISNPYNIRNIPSLNNEVIKYISKTAMLLEKKFKHPVGLEIAYSSEEKSIIIHRIEALTPVSSETKSNYINNFSNFDSLSTQVIYSKSHEIIQINNKNQFIAQVNIQTALLNYLNLKEDQRSKVKVIVVDKKNNKHPKIISGFIKEEKAIATIDFKKFKTSIMRDRDISFLIDTQNDLLYNLNKTQYKNMSLDELKNSKIITDGLSQKDQCFSIDIYQDATCQDHQLPLFYSSIYDTREEEIKKETFFYRKIDKLRKFKACKTEEKQCLKDLFRQKSLLQDMENALSYHAHLARHIKNIAKENDKSLSAFFENFLKASLFQLTTPNIINSLSINSLIKKDEDISSVFDDFLWPLYKSQKISNALIINEEGFSLTNKGLEHIFAEDLKLLWIVVIDKAFSNEKLRGALTALIYKLEDLNLLSLWINTSFAVLFKEHDTADDVREKFSTILNNFNESHEFFATTSTKHHILEKYNYNKWETTSSFDDNIKFLEENFLLFFTSMDFLDVRTVFKNSITTSLKVSFAESFTKIFRTFKYTVYKDKLRKLKDYHKLIDKYLDFIDSWATAEPDIFKTFSLKKVTSKVKKEFRKKDKTFSENDYFKSKDINAQILTDLERSKFDTQRLKTLEDNLYFVRLLLKIMTTSLYKNHIIVKYSLPKVTKLILAQMEDIAAEITNVNFTKNSLKIYLTLPTAENAINLNLTYKKATNSHDLTIQLVNKNSHNYFNQIKFISSIFATLTRTSLRSVSINSNELELQIKDINIGSIKLFQNWIGYIKSIVKSKVIVNEMKSIARTISFTKNNDLVSKLDTYFKNELIYGRGFAKTEKNREGFSSPLIDLCIELTERNIFLDANALVLDVALKDSSNFRFVRNSLNLAKKLVNKGELLDKSIKLAEKRLSSDDWRIRRAAINVYKTLKSKPEYQQLIREIADKVSLDHDQRISTLAIELRN